MRIEDLDALDRSALTGILAFVGLLLFAAHIIGHGRLLYCVAGGSGFFTGVCLWRVGAVLRHDLRGRRAR